MKWDEWVFIGGILIGYFFLSQYIRSRLSIKTNLILSFVWFIALVIFFFAIDAEHRFNTMQLIVLAVAAILWMIIFFYRLKKYRSSK